MAYCDYSFYIGTYHGNVVPEFDFPRIVDRASDFVDHITSDRLVEGLPDNERSQVKIKKAVCAVTDRLYELELAEQQAIAAASKIDTNGVASGIITAQSAGSESISYASPSQRAGGAKEWSAVFSATGDERAKNRLLYGAASLYLRGVTDKNGVCLLYAGM